MIEFTYTHTVVLIIGATLGGCGGLLIGYNIGHTSGWKEGYSKSTDVLKGKLSKIINTINL